VVAALVHPGGSRISLAVDRTKATDARGLAEESRPGLVAQGFSIDRVRTGPHGGVQVEARAVRTKRTIRQLYVVRPLDGGSGIRQAVIVTLTAPDDQVVAASGPFDWVLGRLTLETPLRLDRAPDGGS
jgi:hypothetical protein